MTIKERSLLERMRDDLHGYHVDVAKLITEFKICREDVNKIAIDVYGNPKERKNSPGIMSQLADLVRSRRLQRLGLRGAWVLLTILAGTLISKWFMS